MTDPRLIALLNIWQRANAQGQTPTPLDLCRDCPELADELARRIEDLNRAEPETAGYVVAASCNACGRELPSECRFCPSCGAALAVLSGEATGAYQTPDTAPSKDGRFAPGQVLAGRYRIVSRLGKGGMGEVYRADDLRLGQSVALKFLAVGSLNDPKQLELLHEEVKLSRQISHPNVCRVYDIAEAEGQSFLSMEFIDGEDLSSLLRRIGRLAPDKGIDIARQLCLGLAAAHDKGVIHRDLKPANVMLDGRGQVRITDFGLARLAAQVIGAEARSGTPAYMAPEQLAGKEATVRSDIYALGLMLYEIFTGKRAFKAATPAELAKLQEESTPPSLSSHVAGLDPTVERVILRCLEKDPRKRPPSALAVTAALPGGDPLTAALAAGELPSPEIVAAAGDSGAWPTNYAIACLIGTLAALVCCVLLYDKAILTGRVNMPHSVPVLTDRARMIVEDLGFGSKIDYAVGFDHDEDYLRWIQLKDDSAQRWDRLADDQPAALYFWYRQSPEDYLVPNLFYPYAGTLEPGRIMLKEPAATVEGMVSVKLDLNGNLLELHAVPEKNWPKQPIDWEPFFAAAKLDSKRFEKTTSTHVPPSFADATMSWKGPSPHGRDLVVTVEAAFYHGRPVHFQIIHGRTESKRPTIGAQGMLDEYGKNMAAIFEIAMLLSAVVLAPRNLYLGSADRQGAMRLAYGTFVLLMVVWFFETHHVPSITDELRLLTFGLAFALCWSGMLWLKYIALEPYVRRFWPESLITWTRLLAGQWRDPRLGRDLLLGVFVGVVLGLLDMLGRTLPAWCGAPTPVPYWDWWIPSTFIDGYWSGNFLINLLYSFRWAFFDVLLFLTLRLLLRHSILAIGGYVFFSGALYTGTSAGGFEPSWYWLFCALIQVLTIYLMIRVGIFAMIVAIFAWYCVYFPLTTDFAHNGIYVLACVFFLAGYGF